jgi:hypothetical protein
VIVCQDGNDNQHGISASRRAARSSRTATRARRAAAGVGGGVSRERTDEGGVRAAGGHPVYDVLHVGAARGGQVGWVERWVGSASETNRGASSATDKFCRGGVAAEPRALRPGGVPAGRHDAARGTRRGTGRVSAGVAGLTTMLAFPHSVRIYVALEPVDMRKQYDGLWSGQRRSVSSRDDNLIPTLV